MTWNPRCGYCGLFYSYRDIGKGDCVAPWGGACDYEPPDEEYVCPSCRQKNYAKYVAEFLERGIPPYEYRPLWHPGSAYHDARAYVRSLRRHGYNVPIQTHPRFQRQAA